VPTSIEQVIAAFNSRDGAYSLHDVRTALINARQALASPTPEASLAAGSEIAAFSFVGGQGEQHWRTYFGPLVSGTHDGMPFVAPDIAEVTNDIIEHWKARARFLSHPLLKSRYSDLVWDLARKVGGAPREHEFARIAIDAYLDCVSRELVDSSPRQFDPAFRAHSLASQIGDGTRSADVKRVIMQLHRKTMESDNPTWWMGFDFFIAQQTSAVRDELSEIARDLESVVAKHREVGSHCNPHAVEGAAKRLVSYYRRTRDRDNAKRVFSTIAQVHEHHAAMGDATLSTIVLQKAVDAYKAAGMIVEADHARVRMQGRIHDARSEMRQISHEYTIPREDMETFLDSILHEDPGVTFVRLAAQFLSSQSDTEKQLTKLAEVAPLTAALKSFTLANDHVSAIVGSVEDDKLGREIAQASQNLSVSSVWLSEAMDKAIEKHGWIPEHFVAWTNRLGLFDETSCLMHGFRAWYDGDLVKAIHVLVPQIELGLRGIVASAGKPITKADSARPGVSTAVGIGDMLYNQEIGELIGPDLRLHFLALFADSRGLNLRNRLAHGLLKYDEMHDGIVLWLVQSLLVFGVWDRLAQKRR
jgi:hypothetical protein